MTNTNMDTDAVSEATGVPASTLRYWRSTRNPDGPPSFTIGRRVFYRQADVEAWLQRQYESTVTTGQAP